MTPATAGRVTAFIAAACAAGSTATTLRGAIRFRATHGARSLPLPDARGSCKPRCDFASWGARGPRERVAYLRERDEARADRIAAASALWRRDDAEALASRLTLAGSADALSAGWPYRWSHSRWAGGEHDLRVHVDDAPSVDAGSSRVWSDNGKWAGTNSYAHIAITARAVMLAPTLILDGRVVVDAHPDGRVAWLEQTAGFSLRVVAGFLVNGRLVRRLPRVPATRVATPRPCPACGERHRPACAA